MTGLPGQTRDSHSTDPCSRSASTMPLPPKVEITVERLDGIIWSTPLRNTGRDELKKRVPFVTAAVEFSGTCPNMKVYSASKFPHSKHPAVESYFASLAQDPKEAQKKQVGGSEMRKIISTTTQEGGKTTTTTTTTITTVQSTVNTPVVKYKEGHYPLVAKWHDDSCDEKLIDSVTYFTSPPSLDDAESRTGTLNTQSQQKTNRPHLTLTLPTAAEQQRPSVLSSIFAPCHHRQQPVSKKNQTSKDSKDDLAPTQTHSTAASTTCSSTGRNLPQHQQQGQDGSSHCRSQGGNSSSPFHDLGSLLDQEVEGECQEKATEPENAATPTITRQDEADVSPVVATQKSKELAATAIAAEPSSAVVGQAAADANKASGVFTPLSWITCGTAAPEIVELRVRVMPEDSDEFDEMDPSNQHLAAAQELEGVAHLVFLDQIIEEGTTVMDLPLKISSPDKAMRRNHTHLSTTPAVGEQEFVTLGSHAMLRVRVTILPQGRRQVAQPHQHPQPFSHPTIQQTPTMKTQALPEAGLPFYSRPFSLTNQVYPLMEKIFQIQHFQAAIEKLTKAKAPKAPKAPKQEETPPPKKRGSFPHEFPTVVPDDKSKKVESSFLGERKTHAEPWSWFSGSAKSNATDTRTSHDNTKRKKGDSRLENKKFYTIPDAPNSSSTESESSDDYDSATETEVFTRLL